MTINEKPYQDTIENFSFWADPSVSVYLWKHTHPGDAEPFYTVTKNIILSHDPLQLVTIPLPFAGGDVVEVLKDVVEVLDKVYPKILDKILVIDSATGEPLHEYSFDEDVFNDGESE